MTGFGLQQSKVCSDSSGFGGGAPYACIRGSKFFVPFGREILQIQKPPKGGGGVPSPRPHPPGSTVETQNRNSVGAQKKERSPGDNGTGKWTRKETYLSSTATRYRQRENNMGVSMVPESSEGKLPFTALLATDSGKVREAEGMLSGQRRWWTRWIQGWGTREGQGAWGSKRGPRAQRSNCSSSGPVRGAKALGTSGVCRGSRVRTFAGSRGSGSTGTRGSSFGL